MNSKRIDSKYIANYRYDKKLYFCRKPQTGSMARNKVLHIKSGMITTIQNCLSLNFFLTFIQIWTLATRNVPVKLPWLIDEQIFKNKTFDSWKSVGNRRDILVNL